MITDRELINTYIKPFYGMKNPNIYVELSAGIPMGLLLALTYSV